MERETLDRTSSHRFRSREDVNQYLIREWIKLKGDFVPYNVDRDNSYFDLSNNNDRLLRAIREQKKAFICINDGYEGVDFKRVRLGLHRAFENVLPDRSSFERGD